MSATDSFQVPPGVNSVFLPQVKNTAIRELLWRMDYTEFELTEMQDLIDSVPLLVMCAHNKGVRFEVSDVEESEACITYKKDVVVFRGRFSKFLYNLVKRFEAGLSRV